MLDRPDPAMDTLGEGLASRAVAFGLDALVFVTLWTLLWGLGTGLRGLLDPGLSLLSGHVTAVGVAVWLLTWLLATGLAGAYLAVGPAVAGQSLGKRMTDLVVVRAGGAPCHARAATLRTAALLAPAPVVAVLDLLAGPGGALVGAVPVAAWLVVETAAVLVDDDGRRLGDRLAGTVVVREAMATV